tara:strand:- start:4973 stop:5320 length:348 start_codon:yes stop_codon:yes gene_type:complete
MLIHFIGVINIIIFALVFCKSIVIIVKLLSLTGMYKRVAMFGTVFTIIASVLFCINQIYITHNAYTPEGVVVWLWSGMNFFVSASFLIYIAGIDVWTSLMRESRRMSDFLKGIKN